MGCCHLGTQAKGEPGFVQFSGWPLGRDLWFKLRQWIFKFPAEQIVWLDTGPAQGSDALRQPFGKPGLGVLVVTDYYWGLTVNAGRDAG